MLSATTVTTVVGLMLSPVMSRLYAPAAYGLFAVFNGLVSNLTMISTLAYPSAFLLPRKEEKFRALVQLSVLLATANFGIVSLAFMLLQDSLLRWLQVEALGNWIYAVPATAFVYNLMLIMNACYVRTKEFRKQAGINVITSLAGRSLTLAAGFLLHGSATGLLLGEVFTKVMGTGVVYFSGINRQIRTLTSSFSWTRIWAVGYEYREYPLYVATGGYLNTLALQLPVLVMTGAFGPTNVGFYAFSTSLLELPLGLVGAAISPVFLQKVTETYEHEPNRLPKLCISLYNKLFYVGLVPFGIITVYGDWIFGFVFGSRWEAAGIFTTYLGCYYLFRLASYATSPIYAVLRKQRLALWGVVLLVVVRAFSLGIGVYADDINLGMILFGLGSLAVTFCIDMNILYMLNISWWLVAVRSATLVLLTLIVLYTTRVVIQYLA
ncbi:lipopolysaccharide biosynthesis protein [Hymenobacter arizonensis]|nr:oligosaccharide flippase family protein [Hymenobacter arizonensis]